MGIFKRLLSPLESSAVIEGCYTMDHIPGKKIVKSVGLVEFRKRGINGNSLKSYEGIFNSLLEVSKNAGGNAVVNIRLVVGSYEQRMSSPRSTTYIIVYGDGVVVE